MSYVLDLIKYKQHEATARGEVVTTIYLGRKEYDEVVEAFRATAHVFEPDNKTDKALYGLALVPVCRDFYLRVV